MMDLCLIFDVLVDLIVPEPTVTPPLPDEGSSGLALVEFRQAPQRCAFNVLPHHRNHNNGQQLWVTVVTPPQTDVVMPRIGTCELAVAATNTFPPRNLIFLFFSSLALFAFWLRYVIL
jgi:hypothetical protein